MRYDMTIFITSLGGGGAERVIANLSKWLVRKEWKITILTIFDGEIKYDIPESVDIIPLLYDKEKTQGHLRNLEKRILNLKKYIKTHDTNYLVMLEHPTIMLLGMRKLIKGKVIMSERNYPESYPWYFKTALIHLIKRADGHVFQTPLALEWYQKKGFKSNDATIIPNAINEAFMGIKRYNGIRTKKVVAVGRLTAQKDHASLIRAFANVIEEFPEYILEIYGSGELEVKLKELAEQVGVYDHIHFCGFCNNIYEKIKDAAAYVLSSEYEGIPNSLLEAMAIGLPCIATDCPVGGPSYLIQSGINGILVPVGDIKTLSSAIKKILGDTKYADLLGTRAQEITQKLAPYKVYSEWENYLMKIFGTQ